MAKNEKKKSAKKHASGDEKDIVTAEGVQNIAPLEKLKAKKELSLDQMSNFIGKREPQVVDNSPILHTRLALKVEPSLNKKLKNC